VDDPTLPDQSAGAEARRLFLNRVGAALARWERHGGVAAVVAIDLDRFSRINETWGYAAGDVLLAKLAARLRERFRAADAVVHLGGDKFAVLCDGPSPVTDHAVVTIAERVRAILEEPLELGTRETFLRGSIGLALARPETDAEVLLGDAEAASSEAKRRGGTRWEVFDPVIGRRARAQLELEHQLHRALENEEFRLHYQPIVDLRTGLATGVEALIRWDRPGVGLVAPGEFVPVAEETGLIVPIGRWALTEVARQAVSNPLLRYGATGEPLTVAVNLSPRQLAEPDLPALVAAVLRDAGVSPAQISFELTESALVTDAREAASVLGGLKAIGCRLAIDDFGTGFSSLSHLKHFPIDALKIDRSFVAGVDRSSGDRTISEVIVHLAHSFGLEAVAEGIETHEQLDLLRAMGCDRGQGYRFARPLPLEELTGFVGTSFQWR